MCSKTEQQIHDLLHFAKGYEQSECVEMIAELLSILTPDQIDALHKQQAVNLYSGEQELKPGLPVAFTSLISKALIGDKDA